MNLIYDFERHDEELLRDFVTLIHSSALLQATAGKETGSRGLDFLIGWIQLTAISAGSEVFVLDCLFPLVDEFLLHFFPAN